jgi:hypothetical protein
MIAQPTLPLHIERWGDFRVRELEVEGYAAEVLLQIRQNALS